ncbi:MAG: HTTM domain-containing protein [Pirellulales bacterium]|nr:HTTM domain-containing protein [Pirellulales bacterium]
MIVDYLRELARGTVAAWDRFWFTAVDPATLSLIRILAGAMLFYTHLVWTRGLDDFLGPNSWLQPEAVRTYLNSISGEQSFAWSYFWLIDSPWQLWTVHFAGLVVFAMLTIGWHSRITSVLAWLITVSYVNRLPGSLFGLDQINGLLSMYLMLGPCGARYSVDRWSATRRLASPAALPVAASVGANIATRLMQLHMCVIYFFAGISKLQGPSWWDGSALWGAVANLEYQSIDLTWLATWPLTVAVMTHVTIAWEVSYCALVWPRLTRPIVIALAIPLHMGIAFGLGMKTFGLVMLIGNAAFISPWVVRRVIEGAGQGGAVDSQSAPPARRERAQTTAAGVAVGASTTTTVRARRPRNGASSTIG